MNTRRLFGSVAGHFRTLARRTLEHEDSMWSLTLVWRCHPEDGSLTRF
jgi:hypothetical protein